MTDNIGADIAGAVTPWIGPIIGLGFGIATLRILNSLPYSTRKDIDVLLSKSQRVGNRWVVRVRDSNLNRARRLLQSSGFRITEEFPSIRGAKDIWFEEMRK